MAGKKCQFEPRKSSLKIGDRLRFNLFAEGSRDTGTAALSATRSGLEGNLFNPIKA
jgi:hypothetical protein